VDLETFLATNLFVCNGSVNALGKQLHQRGPVSRLTHGEVLAMDLSGGILSRHTDQEVYRYFYTRHDPLPSVGHITVNHAAARGCTPASPLRMVPRVRNPNKDGHEPSSFTRFLSCERFGRRLPASTRQPRGCPNGSVSCASPGLTLCRLLSAWSNCSPLGGSCSPTCRTQRSQPAFSRRLRSPTVVACS
jgi:hypothetical protein